MDTISLTFKEPVLMDLIFQRANAFGYYLYDGIQEIRMPVGRQIIWDFGNDRVYAEVSKYDNKVLVVEYRSFNYVRDVLCVIAEDPDVIVNDGFGNILPGDEYTELFEENPDRDLREEYRKTIPEYAKVAKMAEEARKEWEKEEEETQTRMKEQQD